MKKNVNKIAVFGSGVWGSVLAKHLAENSAKEVAVWEFSDALYGAISSTGKHPNLEGFAFPNNISFSQDVSKTVNGADLILIATSTKGIQPLCKQLNAALNGKIIPVVSATKGIDDVTLLTVTETIERHIPFLKHRVMAFSGPSFASEVCKKVPTKIMLAGDNAELLEETKSVIQAHPICIETSFDRIGTETAGSVKNVLAVACGIVEGLNTGANTRAALITQGLREMADIIIARGGITETVYGLPGIGDFILTGTSNLSRNTRLGKKIGQGKPVDQARAEIGTATEGADSALSIYKITSLHSLNTPIIKAVYSIIVENAPAGSILKALGFYND